MSSRRALLVIDMQDDFFADEELERRRDDLVAACNLLIRRARDHDAPVFEVRTEHAHDGSTWTLNMREDLRGMALEGTPGAERVRGLEGGDEVVTKTRDSAFHGTDLLARLHEAGVDALVLCGVSTESCIAATATDAYALDFRVTLVEDATASVKWEQHDHTLERLSEHYRQEILSSAAVRFDQAH